MKNPATMRGWARPTSQNQVVSPFAMKPKGANGCCLRNLLDVGTELLFALPRAARGALGLDHGEHETGWLVEADSR